MAAVVWTDFIDKIKHWAERESNELGVKFYIESIDEDTIKITSQKDNKIYRLKYSRKEYYNARNKHSDSDILPVLFQILKEKYRPIKWSVVSGKGGKSYAWPT